MPSPECGCRVIAHTCNVQKTTTTSGIPVAICVDHREPAIEYCHTHAKAFEYKAAMAKYVSVRDSLHYTDEEVEAFEALKAALAAQTTGGKDV